MKSRGKHTSMIREEKLVHRSGGTTVSAVPCLGGRCESWASFILAAQGEAGSDEFARAREMQGIHDYDGMRR